MLRLNRQEALRGITTLDLVLLENFPMGYV